MAFISESTPRAAANESAIVEFLVDDVDDLFTRPGAELGCQAAEGGGRQGGGGIGAERLAAVEGAEDDRAEEQFDDGIGIEVRLPQSRVETLLNELPARAAPLGEQTFAYYFRAAVDGSAGAEQLGDDASAGGLA